MAKMSRTTETNNLSKLPQVIAGALITIILYDCIYLEQLQLSIDNPSMWFCIGLVAIIAIPLIGNAGISREQIVLQNRSMAKTAKLLGSAILIALLLAVFYSSTMNQTVAHKQLITSYKFKQGSLESLPSLNVDKAPLVSQDMAILAARKRISDQEDASLGSRVSIGYMEKQRVGDGLYWVGFLEHSGFFKWNANSTTPGYVMVNAHNPDDVKIVTHLNGKPLALKYLTSAYFDQNAERHVYFSGNMSTGLTDWSPEIDDEGRPYLVITVFERKIGMFGKDATGVILLDVQTGDIQKYSIENTPAWVDRIQPEDFIEHQLKNHLELAGGYFNPSGTNKLTTTNSIDMFYGSDDQPYFYIGHKSTGNDAGIVGFSLINTRTKEVTNVRLSGITEEKAQSAAEKAFPEKHYAATNALPFMIEGIPTYVMALRDSEGISRMYAMVSVESIQRIAVANTLSATMQQYLARVALDPSKTTTVGVTAPTLKTVEGKITRIGSIVKSGETSYVLMVEGYNRLLIAGSGVSDELAVTEKGNQVKIQVNEGKSTTTVVEFENNSLELKKK